MGHDQLEKVIVRRSTLIYVPISLGTALLFLLAASVFGSYPPVAKIGGTIWIALLSLIVSMPLVTARVKKQLRNKAPMQ